MGDYDKKINPTEHDPYENLSVNPIEKDKKSKDEYPKPFPEGAASRSQIFALLVAYFKKFVALFGFQDRGSHLLLEQHQLFIHLAAFRAQLLTLSEQDESYNPEFTQQLAELWHNLIDDCNSVSYSLGSSSKIFNNIKFLLSQISQYPPNIDHSLGYYLDEYAGKDWIPFPFMDILKELYTEHQKDPRTSHLSKWIFLLDAVLNIFTEEEQ